MSTPNIDLTLTLNGNAVGPLSMRADASLLEFLHEEMGMTGTKFGCGIGVCQACVVMVRDGRSSRPQTINACITPASLVNGKHVTTVEGLAVGGELSPLQRAFLDHYAFQCGYCTSGYLIAASVLLEELRAGGNRLAEKDLDAKIMGAIGRNLCRCTGYVKYVQAIRAVIKGSGLVAD